MKILRDSSSDIAQKAYRKESGDIIKLLADLRGSDASDVIASRIGEWVDELEVDQDNYIATQNHRYDEAGEKPACE